MFSGKTRGAEKLIADSVLQEGRVLIVSNRVTLVHDHISNFNKVVKAAWMNAHGTECPDRLLFVQYNKTVKGANLAEVPRLVCQAESLGRLQGAEPYNQVLMDESESILAQLSSKATMEDRAGIVTQVLYDVLMKGHKVVFADAYMTRRTLNLVHHIFDARNDKVKVIYNSWCQRSVLLTSLTKKSSQSSSSSALQLARIAQFSVAQKHLLTMCTSMSSRYYQICQFCIIHETLRARRRKRIWLM